MLHFCTRPLLNKKAWLAQRLFANLPATGNLLLGKKPISDGAQVDPFSGRPSTKHYLLTKRKMVAAAAV